MIAELRTTRQRNRAAVARPERSSVAQLRGRGEARAVRAPPRVAPGPLSAPPPSRVRGEPHRSGVDGTLLARIEQHLERVERRLARLEKRLPSQVPPALPPASAYAIAGRLRQDLLGDILQLLSSNQMSGKFVVKNGGTESALWFDDGRICHTEVPGLEGEAAFFAVFASREGEYYFEETTDLPAEKTITSSTQFLILEALRQIDESEAE